MKWLDEAECRDADDEYFFPEGDKDVTKSLNKLVIRAFCNYCPVRQECLDYALELEGQAHRRERYGVWGGMTPFQRESEAMRRGIKQGTPKERAQRLAYGLEDVPPIPKPWKRSKAVTEAYSEDQVSA